MGSIPFWGSDCLIYFHFLAEVDNAKALFFFKFPEKWVTKCLSTRLTSYAGKRVKLLFILYPIVLVQIKILNQINICNEIQPLININYAF